MFLPIVAAPNVSFNTSMKRLFKPVGHFLTTAALTSTVLEGWVHTSAAIAHPDPQTPTENSELPPAEEQDSLNPASVSTPIASPEVLPKQEFSAPTAPSDIPSESTASESGATPSDVTPETPASQNTGETPQPDEQPVTSNDAASPAVAPTIPEEAATPDDETPLSRIEAIRQMLAEKLAALLERDRPEREAELQQNLIKSALDYAQKGLFDLARQTAQHPALPPDIQTELLDQIAAIEAQNPTPVAVAPDALTAPAPTVVRRPAPTSLGVVRRPSVGQIPQLSTASFRYILPPSHEACADKPTLKKNPTKCNPMIGGKSINLMAMRQSGLAMLFPLSIPAAITSPFGWRIHPISGDHRFHAGTDLGAPMGTPVLAAMAGTVTLADSLGGYGLTVVLEHDDVSKRTLYAHLSGIAVQPGTKVEQGMVIGWVGSTGNSTGPHLHFEIHERASDGWVAVDPMPMSDTVLAQGED